MEQMSQSHLTHKYRPQRFTEVAGQDMIKAILSRAAETNSVAPAYLFSGTRGVGKTTIARIFAKAINCENGPAAEPCNECAHCRQIQSGAAVDVQEIDGASHTGVDNVRALKEDVGFAPITCRYKVFIIDEAHMLSKGAFNALLKTLEEPPPHTTFIMATTEPHKFPATIISRCQHYTYQRLAQAELEAHLKAILEAEDISFDEDAIALIARRGAGSVRDSMSIMGQVLALGSDRLTAEDVRQVLGLVGRDIVFSLLGAVHGQDCVAVSNILRDILDQGLDLGFFLRELTECWRNLFLISQAGDKAFEALDVPDSEAQAWKEWAGKFSLAHAHACWQMTLEGQQRVKQSLEPALALELLLLNLAFLPRLMPLENIAATGKAPAPSASAPDAPRASAPQKQAPPQPPAAKEMPKPSEAPQPEPSAAQRQPAAPARENSGGASSPQDEAEPVAEDDPTGPAVDVPVPDGPRSWDGFVEYVSAVCEANGDSDINGLSQASGELDGDTLVVNCRSRIHSEQLRRGKAYLRLKGIAGLYFGPKTVLDFRVPERQKRVSHKESKSRALDHPVVSKVMDEFDGRLMDARQAPGKSRNS